MDKVSQVSVDVLTESRDLFSVDDLVRDCRVSWHSTCVVLALVERICDVVTECVARTLDFYDRIDIPWLFYGLSMELNQHLVWSSLISGFDNAAADQRERILSFCRGRDDAYILIVRIRKDLFEVVP